MSHGVSNRECVGRGLDLLTEDLGRKMRRVHGDQWAEAVQQGLSGARRIPRSRGGDCNLDNQALLDVTWNQRNAVFASRLGRRERYEVAEPREVRNDWAHAKPFTTRGIRTAASFAEFQ